MTRGCWRRARIDGGGHFCLILVASCWFIFLGFRQRRWYIRGSKKSFLGWQKLHGERRIEVESRALVSPRSPSNYGLLSQMKFSVPCREDERKSMSDEDCVC